MPFVDLSHPVRDGEVTYPGLPAPSITTHLGRDEAEELYAPGVTFHIGRVDLVANTGTYLDAPFHRFADGVDVAGLALDRIAGLPGVVVDAGPGPIEDDALPDRDLRGTAVLLRTGWSRHWATAAYAPGEHPHLTAAAAEALVAGRVALVGIDSVNIDSTDDGRRPAHTALLGAGIPIVEHLCRLDSLPTRAFTFTAVPAPVAGVGTFPVRAYASW